MSQHEISPPWVEYPDISPDNIFWRQEGEPWALYVWLPYWTALTEEQRGKFIDQWKVPEKWREFYDKEFQDWLATLDGPSGWILRNNLCPVDADKPRYTSVVASSNYSQSSVFLSWCKKILWWVAVIGAAIVIRIYFY